MGQMTPTADGSVVDARAVPRQTPWGILALLCVGVLVAFLDRSSISAVLADREFTGYFGLSPQQRGWLGAAFFWSYALAQVPMGWIADRFGVKYPYAICFALWCFATVVAGTMTAFAGLIVTRVFVGIAEGMVNPASYRWIRLNIPERHAGMALGLFLMGNQTGTAIGAPIAAWLIVSHSWRMMFFFTGALALLWLIPWMLLVRNDYPKGEQLAVAMRRAAAVPMRNILASPVVWGAMITNFCYSYFLYFCMTWMPSYLVDQRGLSLSQSGFYTFFSFAGIALVSVIAGWVADRIIARGSNAIFVRKAFVLAGFIGATSVLFGAYVDSLPAALFWNIFSLSCLGLASANNLVLTKITLVPAPAVGIVTGVQHLAAGLSGGTTAMLSGWLLHVSGSYDLPMKVIVVFLLIGAASNLILLRPKWSPKVVATSEPA